MSSTSFFRNPSLYWAISVATLLAGASFVYVSIKAPFFWGGIYLPGIILLNVWALSTIVGAWVYLRRRQSQ